MGETNGVMGLGWGGFGLCVLVVWYCSGSVCENWSVLRCRGGGAMACEAGSYLDGDISGYEQDVRDTVKVAGLVGDFRVRGHLCANLDPLRRTKSGPWLSEVPCNQPRYLLLIPVQIAKNYLRLCVVVT